MTRVGLEKEKRAMMRPRFSLDASTLSCCACGHWRCSARRKYSAWTSFSRRASSRVVARSAKMFLTHGRRQRKWRKSGSRARLRTMVAANVWRFDDAVAVAAAVVTVARRALAGVSTRHSQTTASMPSSHSPARERKRLSRVSCASTASAPSRRPGASTRQRWMATWTISRLAIRRRDISSSAASTASALRIAVCALTNTSSLSCSSTSASNCTASGRRRYLTALFSIAGSLKKLTRIVAAWVWTRSSPGQWRSLRRAVTQFWSTPLAPLLQDAALMSVIHLTFAWWLGADMWKVLLFGCWIVKPFGFPAYSSTA
mmetsp:Transcript_9161/g.37756  ORF Transcript_9161/g.37756 Transcript_9161/m.37756 type:complete len:315 (-) Transcript_9161:490-1434(-)